MEDRQAPAVQTTGAARSPSAVGGAALIAGAALTVIACDGGQGATAELAWAPVTDSPAADPLTMKRLTADNDATAPRAPGGSLCRWG